MGDREGLGALVTAIKDYKGGVLIISHNKEFCDNVATEKWIMQGGKLRIEGAQVEEKEEKETGNKTQEDIYDAAGNKIDVKQNQKREPGKPQEAGKHGRLSLAVCSAL